MTDSILKKVSQFPISAHLDSICDELRTSPSHILILTAETAAGKSTVLPLALLDQFQGKILMTEPRRLAVLGVANRLATLRDEAAGETVGYKIHLENRVGKNTRLEIVTEGILVNQLQADPALEDYQVVVIDEFHERSVNTDLAVAFLKEALELRDDLYVIIMSATINTEKIQSYFGGIGEAKNSVPLLQIPGRQFPVDISYNDKWSVCQAVEEALRIQKEGNILVFLPGISDIRKNEELLTQNLSDDIEICILHSSISLEEQKRVISENPDTPRRVILSSAIAETSLTVPGVTCVIDTGLARVNRMNISTGMENLTTEVESEFSAEQRAGRAGRICAGKCIRLWSQFDPRIKNFPPEILRADITGLVLECAERGVFSYDGIDWLDKPNSGAWAESTKLLKNLGLLKEDGHISEEGKIALKLGIHPRLAGIALGAFDGKKICDAGIKLLLKYSSYAKSSEDLKRRFIADLERRLAGCSFNTPNGDHNTPKSAADLILCGYADRLAHRVTESGKMPAEYQFPGGRKALIYEGPSPEWIVAPEVMAGKSEGTIFEFEEIPEQKVQNFMKTHSQIRQKCEFVDGKVQKNEILCYGEIIISSKKMQVSPEDTAAAWVTEVQKKGFDVIPCDEKISKFLLRVEFWNQQKGENIDVLQKLVQEVDQWLPSFLGNSSKLTSQIIYDAFYWYLDGAKIDVEVPEILVLSNGRRCKVKYEKQAEIKPIIEIIIQRIFGCFETPEICGKKVLLRLLSPASRPLQVTEDLEHFWTGAWVEICKEMKGRYPKHNWDYKVVEKGE